MLEETHVPDTTVPEAVSISAEATTTTTSFRSSTGISNSTTPSTTTRWKKFALKKRQNTKRHHGPMSKKSSSSSLEATTQPSLSSSDRDDEAVLGAVPVPGYNVRSLIQPLDGDTVLVVGNNHGVHDERPLSSLVVASPIEENGGNDPAENLEQRLHQAVELLMHHRTIVQAETIVPFHQARASTTVDDNRSKWGFFHRNWRLKLILFWYWSPQ